MHEKDVTKVGEVGYAPHPQLTSGWLYALTKAGALAGGFVFIAIAVMLVVTIISRKLFFWQVPGDVELVQMGAALAAAPFFAWCHLVRGEVKVDFATNFLPEASIAVLEGIGSLLIGVFGLFITWRTGALAVSSYGSGEGSAVLGWPVWLAQAIMVPGLALLALVGFHEAVRAFSFALSSRHKTKNSKSSSASLETSR